MLSLLEVRGYVEQGSALQLHRQLENRYSRRRSDGVRWPIQQGTFDNEFTRALAIRLWDRLEVLLDRRIDEGTRVLTAIEDLLRHPRTPAGAEARRRLMDLEIDPTSREALRQAAMRTLEERNEDTEHRERIRAAAQQGEDLRDTRPTDVDSESDEE